MSPEFLRALDFTLPWETGNKPDGGYTDDPHDPGGETRWGISKRSYPDVDIAALTRAGAVEIYHADYWLGTGNQKSYCNTLRSPLCLVHFDCVVNIGNRKTTADGAPLWHGRANMILQRALGVDDDGLIGPRTLAAIAARAPRTAALRALDQRVAYYMSLKHLQRYLKGWLRRTSALRALIEEGK